MSDQVKKEYLWSDRKRTLFGLPWSFTVYALDEERFYRKTGFLTTKRDEVRLYRIMDLSMRQTLGQKLFGLGTISCCSGDKNLADFEIINIKNPETVFEMMSEKVEEQRDKKRVVSREMLHDDGTHDDFDQHDEDQGMY